MPHLFFIGKYRVYFWASDYKEPIHVHICHGQPHQNATKFWLTQNRGVFLAHNKSKIPEKDLKQIENALLVGYANICSQWKKAFHTEEITFYC